MRPLWVFRMTYVFHMCLRKLRRTQRGHCVVPPNYVFLSCECLSFSYDKWERWFEWLQKLETMDIYLKWKKWERLHTHTYINASKWERGRQRDTYMHEENNSKKRFSVKPLSSESLYQCFMVNSFTHPQYPFCGIDWGSSVYWFRLSP